MLAITYALKRKIIMIAKRYTPKKPKMDESDASSYINIEKKRIMVAKWDTSKTKNKDVA